MNRIFTLNATTISDAWFQLIYNIPDYGYKQTIQTGSFEGEYRIQYPGAAIHIAHPDKDMVPYIPQELGIPSPTTKEYIEDYFADYIMNPELSENETYRYSSRINHLMPNGKTQLQDIIDEMTVKPLGNQFTCEIGSPEDRAVCFGNDGKLDPPCLRLIDFKVIPQENGTMKLSVTVFFRSWDLWAGFPTNLGGIELLKQFVVSQVNDQANKELLINGDMFAYSSGLHLYGYQEAIAKLRTRR